MRWKRAWLGDHEGQETIEVVERGLGGRGHLGQDQVEGVLGVGETHQDRGHAGLAQGLVQPVDGRRHAEHIAYALEQQRGWAVGADVA